MENVTEMTNDTNATGESPKSPLMGMYFTIDVTGIVLNILVILMITCRPVINSKISRALVVNQCLTDAIGALIAILTGMTNNDIRVPENILGDLFCHVWWSGFLEWCFVQASVCNVMLFTVERYLSIVRPLTHQRLTIRVIYGLIAFCMIMGCFISLGAAFESERRGVYCQEAFIAPIPLAVNGHFVLLFYFVPIILLIALYSHMIYFLRRQSQHTGAARPNQTYTNVSNDLSITVAVATVMYTLLFAPAVFTNYLRTLGIIEIEFDGWLVDLYTFLVSVNFVVNPLVFVVFMRSFRRELRRLFCKPTETTEARTRTTEISSHSRV